MIGPLDEHAHPEAAVEEWLFTCWAPDGTLGLINGLRIHPGRAWYWAALVEAGRPLLHVAEWDVPRRADPLLVKAPGLWAEHVCDEPFEQWTVGNETYAAALEDPGEALERAYGAPTALAWDLEWYAVAPPQDEASGYHQRGVVHGEVEIGGRGPLHLEELPAWRRHRWGPALPVEHHDRPFAHLGLRAPFRFPDGTVVDWVLTRDGWCAAA